MRERSDLFGRPDSDQWSGMRGTQQHIPVNVYETEGDVVVIAPMPGVQAEDIDVQVQGTTVSIRAGLRGPGQENRRYLRHEWTYGPYQRTVELPLDIDAEHANASHSNGILVVSFPKGPRSRAVRVPLEQIGAAEAVHRGHAGHHTLREGLPPESGEEQR